MNVQGVFSPCLSDNRLPDAIVIFITLSKGYHHCYCLSGSRRLLKLPIMTRQMQHWQSVGRSIGTSLVLPAEKEHPVLTSMYLLIV